MRTRIIKPGFFVNEDLGACKPLARILYSGLWCYADKEGRFEMRPSHMKTLILPYDNVDINELLIELFEFNLVIPYIIDGQMYGFVPTFLEHQSPHPKEKSSMIPECSTGQEITGNYRELLEKAVKHINRNRNRKGNRTKGESEGESRNGFFVTFWKAYPKKKSKGQAEKAFNKIKPDEQLLETMVSTIERAKKSEDWMKENGKYIPYPATWLNAKGWEDEFVVPDTSTPTVMTNPVCEKCREKEAVAQFDDGSWICRDCWPNRHEALGELGKHVAKIGKAMCDPEPTVEEEEKRIANLRKQAELLKKAELT